MFDESVLVPLHVVRSRVATYVPCICTPDYTERRIIDPPCSHHDAMDAIDELAEEYPF